MYRKKVSFYFNTCLKASSLNSILGDVFFSSEAGVRPPVSMLAEAGSIYLHNVCFMTVSKNFWLLSGTF